MSFLIRKLVQIRKSFPLTYWDGLSFNILVNESDKLRKRLISEELSKRIKDKYQVLFARNKLDFLSLCQGAHAIFSYDLSKYADTQSLRLLFIAKVGEAPKLKETTFKIVTIPNFAAAYISDFVLASVFAYERSLLQNAFSNNNTKWNQRAYLNPSPRTFDKLRIGIVGLGNVGGKIAKAFLNNGCKVYGYDLHPEKYFFGINNFSEAKWPDMVTHVDYLIIAVCDGGNKDLVNSSVFGLMDQNLCLVNVSRGIVVNEIALLEALREKRIRGAILDVFNKEPLKRNNALLRYPNVIISPHIAGNIDLVFQEIVEHFCNKIQEVISV